MNSHKKTLITILSLFAISFILRLLLISKGPYHIDCFNIAILAEKTLETQKLHYLFGSGYPLTILLGALFISIARALSITDPIIAVNFMSVFFSSLCVPLLYVIGKKLLDHKSALLSALMFCICPIFLGISVYGKSHAPSLFFLLLGILSLLSFNKNSNKKHLVAGCLWIGLMGATRLQDMILMSIPLSYLLLLTKENRSIKNFMLFWGPASLITLVFHIPLLLNAQTSGYSQQFANFWRIGLTSNFKGLISDSLIASLIFLAKSFTLAGLGVALIGFLSLIKKSPRTLIFLLLWLLVPLGFYGNLHTSAPRFLTIILPPILIAQGYVFARLMSINKKFHLATLFLYALILLLCATSIIPKLHFRHKHALLPQYAKWVGAMTEPNARIICSDDSQFYSYYGQRQPLDRLLRDKVVAENEELLQYRNRLDKMIEDGVPIYITCVGLYAYDYNKNFSRFIKSNYQMEFIGSHFYEDWHKGSLWQAVFNCSLYRLKKPSSR